jgi:single-strand DNA-binding protein
MAGETLLTIVGNLTADPELRYTQNGVAVANLTVASTPRHFDKNSNEWVDDDALFMRCNVWKEFAEHVSGSLHKGDRVIVQGRLKQRSYETKEGEKRTVMELEVDEMAPSLRYATAQVLRVTGGGNRNQQQRQGQYQQQRGGASQPQQQTDPWGAPQQQQFGGDGWSTPGAYDDETPF